VGKLFNVGTSIFEALISGLLWIFGLLASIIVFYAYLIQKFILYLGYALSPIFIGFLAIRALNQIGVTTCWRLSASCCGRSVGLRHRWSPED